MIVHVRNFVLNKGNSEKLPNYKNLILTDDVACTYVYLQNSHNNTAND